MKKLAVLAAFSAFAVAAHSAAACDWNREANANDHTVAAASDQNPQPTPACDGTNCPAPQPTSVASKETRQTVNEPAPIVQITNRN
jgi:hypothetical protein